MELGTLYVFKVMMQTQRLEISWRRKESLSLQPTSDSSIHLALWHLPQERPQRRQFLAGAGQQLRLCHQGDGHGRHQVAPTVPWSTVTRLARADCGRWNSTRRFDAGAQKKVFEFMARGVTETFTSQLTAKYTVSKELGKGAIGTVRLGFWIPDLQRVAIKIIEKEKFSTISSMTASTDSQVLPQLLNTNNLSNLCLPRIMNEVKLLQAINYQPPLQR